MKIKFIKQLIELKKLYYTEWLNNDTKYPKWILKIVSYLVHRAPLYPYTFSKFIKKDAIEGIKERIESEIRLNPHIKYK